MTFIPKNDPVYRKFFVYIDDGENQYRIAIAAACEDSARAYCDGNGEIVAVKDVTERLVITADEVFQALNDAGFSRVKMDFILRCLAEFDITED